MLDLKPYITKEILVKKYSREVFSHYFMPFEEGKLYRSPFRSDKKPSFNIYESRKDPGVLIFKDFAGYKGSCIDFVMFKYNLGFYEAISKIVEDMRLPYRTRDVKGGSNPIAVTVKKAKEKKQTKLIPVCYIHNGKYQFTETDKEYWLRKHKVTDLSYLRKHRVLSARELIINGASVWAATEGDPIYIYMEKYMTRWYKKAYRPYAPDGDKWRSDFPDAANIIHGIDLLKGKTDDVIITKSVKDNIILDVLGFEAISTQGEDMSLNPHIVDMLRKWYKNIYVLYDNDYNKEENIGRKLGEKLATAHDLRQIIIPESYEYTDVAELITAFSKNTLKTLIEKWKN